MEEVAIVAAPAILVFAKYLASGVGSVAGPMLASWKARAEADAKRITARGEADALAIIAEAQAGALPLIAGAQEDVRKQLLGSGLATKAEVAMSKSEIEQRVWFQEEKRQRNISAVAHQAFLELPDTNIGDHEPDHDWTARYFSDVQDVSSEEMQSLWARILAGEVQRPGSTSIRTLTILKNIDQQTAALFKRLCSMSVSI